MKLYVLSTHPVKRGARCLAPEVFTDAAKATRRFWDYCGGNMSINPEGETLHEHWKTKTISRCDVVDVAGIDAALIGTALERIQGIAERSCGRAAIRAIRTEAERIENALFLSTPPARALDEDHEGGGKSND